MFEFIWPLWPRSKWEKICWVKRWKCICEFKKSLALLLIVCRLEQNEVEMHNFLHDYSSNGTFGTRCIHLLVFWLLIRNRKLFLIIRNELHLPKCNYLVTRPCTKPFFNEFGKIFFHDKKCSWNRAPFFVAIVHKVHTSI